MGAVRGAERVVHVRLAERGQFLAERGIVLLLALVEAQVLHHQHVAVAQRGGFRAGVVAHRVGGEHHGLAHKLGELRGGGTQREQRCIRDRYWSSQMAVDPSCEHQKSPSRRYSAS